MKKCSKCGRYTLGEKCVICNVKTKAAEPAKFSASDKFGKYRRMARVKTWKQQ